MKNHQIWMLPGRNNRNGSKQWRSQEARSPTLALWRRSLSNGSADLRSAQQTIEETRLKRFRIGDLSADRERIGPALAGEGQR